jgi:3-phosphoshikimate 1-carboxyvinyltransferase
LKLPADKSISHRAALLAAMGSEPARTRNFLNAADTNSTLAAVRRLGAHVEARANDLVVHGTSGRRRPWRGAM